MGTIFHILWEPHPQDLGTPFIVLWESCFQVLGTCFPSLENKLHKLKESSIDFIKEASQTIKGCTLRP